jgi:hypothetical protein
MRQGLRQRHQNRQPGDPLHPTGSRDSSLGGVSRTLRRGTSPFTGASASGQWANPKDLHFARLYFHCQ